MSNTDIKGKAGCPLCNGTGYKNSAWGTKVLCDCVIDLLNNAEEEAAKPIQNNELVDAIKTDRAVYLQQLINEHIIAEKDINLEYSRDYALKSLASRCEALHLKISKGLVTDCLDVMDSIITTLKMGKLPTKSYAIGIENGIGKTTFATTAIKAAAASGFSVVPYIDMTTLAEKYNSYSKELRYVRQQMTDGKNLKDTATEKFGWSDYVNADFVATCLTGGNADIAYVELDTLLALMTRRAIQHKPTLVIMRTPVEYYIRFEDVRKYFIKEIFAIKDQPGTLVMLEPHYLFTKEPVM